VEVQDRGDVRGEGESLEGHYLTSTVSSNREGVFFWCDAVSLEEVPSGWISGVLFGGHPAVGGNSFQSQSNKVFASDGCGDGFSNRDGQTVTSLNNSTSSIQKVERDVDGSSNLAEVSEDFDGNWLNGGGRVLGLSVVGTCHGELDWFATGDHSLWWGAEEGGGESNKVARGSFDESASVGISIEREVISQSTVSQFQLASRISGEVLCGSTEDDAGF